MVLISYHSDSNFLWLPFLKKLRELLYSIDFCSRQNIFAFNNFDLRLLFSNEEMLMCWAQNIIFLSQNHDCVKTLKFGKMGRWSFFFHYEDSKLFFFLFCLICLKKLRELLYSIDFCSRQNIFAFNNFDLRLLFSNEEILMCWAQNIIFLSQNHDCLKTLKFRKMGRRSLFFIMKTANYSFLVCLIYY